MSTHDLAARMREARLAANLRLIDIAEAWGCTAGNVSRALSGEQSITTEQLTLFAALAGVSSASLLGETKGDE